MCRRAVGLSRIWLISPSSTIWPSETRPNPQSGRSPRQGRGLCKSRTRELRSPSNCDQQLRPALSRKGRSWCINTIRAGLQILAIGHHRAAPTGHLIRMVPNSWSATRRAAKKIDGTFPGGVTGHASAGHRDQDCDLVHRTGLNAAWALCATSYFGAPQRARGSANKPEVLICDQHRTAAARPAYV